MLTEDVFTHASIEQASSHRATIEAEHRACIEPQHRDSIETASSFQHRASRPGLSSGSGGPNKPNKLRFACVLRLHLGKTSHRNQCLSLTVCLSLTHVTHAYKLYDDQSALHLYTIELFYRLASYLFSICRREARRRTAPLHGAC